MKGRVLVVDDDGDAVHRIAAALRALEHEVIDERDSRASERALRGDVEVVVTRRVTDLAIAATGAAADVPVVVVLDETSESAAIDALGAGAFDVLDARIAPALLAHAIDRALRHRRTSTALAQARAELAERRSGIGGWVPPTSASAADDLVSVAELERRYVAHVLSVVKGNKSRAARILGFDRRTLYRKLERTAAEAVPEDNGGTSDDG